MRDKPRPRVGTANKQVSFWRTDGASFDRRLCGRNVIGRSPSQPGVTRELSRRCPSCSCHWLAYRTWSHSSVQTSEPLHTAEVSARSHKQLISALRPNLRISFGPTRENEGRLSCSARSC